jgi:DNA-binding winged helix-turn-helix (wHTH) protein
LLIDLATRRVTRTGTEIPLSSLSFDLLLKLARAAPAIQTLEQIMQRVWPRLVVGPETLTQRIKVMREALGDDASDPKYIAGVRGRGYRMVAPVTPVPSPLHELQRMPPTAETSPPSPAVQASGGNRGAGMRRPRCDDCAPEELRRVTMHSCRARIRGYNSAAHLSSNTAGTRLPAPVPCR